MFARFQRINGVAVLRDFSWPTGVPDLARRNLVYGWNGAGKTSLAEVLRCLETGKNPDKVSFTLQSTEGLLRSDSIESCRLPIRVFTRSFVDQNVFSGTVRPIVYIGSANVEKKLEIDELDEQLRACRQAESDATTSLRDAMNALDRHCTTVGKTVREALLGEPPPYKDYDRRNYHNRLRQLQGREPSESILSEVELIELDHDRHAVAKPAISWTAPHLPSLSVLHQETEELLRRDVLAHPIESLRADPTLEAWCSQGLSIHEDRHSEDCLFCGKPISKERLQEFRGHFSSSYQSLQDELGALLERLAAHERAVTTSETLPRAQEFYDSLQPRYEPLAASLLDTLRRYRAYVDELRVALEARRRSPIGPPSTCPKPPPDLNIDSFLSQLSELIDAHYAKTSTLTDLGKRACQRIEDHHVAAAITEHDRLSEAVAAAEGQLEKARTATSVAEAQLRDLQASITPHADSADELNRDLERYLGHSDLRFEVAEDGYQIVRRGERNARGLSEGERTAIALLYFLQSLKERDLDISRCVVVLDDPVSSLDSNSLFNAFSFIQERTKEVGQLVVLYPQFLILSSRSALVSACSRRVLSLLAKDQDRRSWRKTSAAYRT